MAEGNGVLVVGEFADGAIADVTGELLGVGRKLADSLGEELIAVFMGEGIAAGAGGAFPLGADQVYAADDPILRLYQPESYAAILERLVKEMGPSIVVMGTGTMGRDLAPKLACRLGTGLAMDCVDLNVDAATRDLVATRPVFGGKAVAEVDCGTARPAMATVRLKSQSPLEPNPSRSGEVVRVEIGLDPSIARTVIVDTVAVEVKGIVLEDARIVVGGGRGLGSRDNWRRLEELATTFGGAVGSTRGACDEGYCTLDTQLGITSKTVAPELYLAVGISGASQHMSGVAFSKYIMAINKDPDAPIFKQSQFGIVGRWEDVLPAFHTKVKELLSG
ncbi:MAG: electron transfer flavoprotein subunit alpha/FixB family protein [Chloroflexi bacterium]|nr:electron transfer flavoprotein subunit alpha/FixB family protein [Chloroflexota bacterium]